MFTMAKIKATRGNGKDFYLNHLSADDYYSEHERITGEWRGSLAEDFGLRFREVESATFSLLQRNINPETLEKLTQRTNGNGIRFYDFQCSAQKSVSVMSIFDERLIGAHQDAVREAMKELEKLAAVRIREGDNTRTHNHENTGKILYAEFLHDTSRKLDPQLHAHNVIANVTKTADGKYKALETLEMCRAIRYAGKVYQNEMAMRCRALGYDVESRFDGKGQITGFELAGVSEEVQEVFSQRRRDIEAEMAKFERARGRKPTIAEVNAMTLTTRGAKLINIDSQRVLAYQLERLPDEERQKLASMAERAKASFPWHPFPDVETVKTRILELVPGLFERESVLTQDKILAEILNRNLGQIDLEILKDVMTKIPELRNLGGENANPYYSTEEIIERELYALEAVEDQQNIFPEITMGFEPFKGIDGREKQAELIKGILRSKDRFVLFRGVAGSGKTSTLQELCNGLRCAGISSIQLIAPTNSAVDVLKSEGFDQSRTVAAFLLSNDKPERGSYVIIDESGLNSLREGVEIVKLARMNNYRVLFVGDARQHTAVESGDFFRLLEDHSKIQKFELSDIYRQQSEEYRRGIAECAMGEFEAAFERFDENGFIQEGKADYLAQAATSFMDFTDDGRAAERAVAVAPTHEESDKLTDAIRDRLKSAGTLKRTGESTEVFRSWGWPKAKLANAKNYRPGMTVGFIRRLKGVAEAGTMATIEQVSGKYLRLDGGRELYAPQAAEFLEVGEKRDIELCPGDLIQFNANIRDKRIYNGSIARITDTAGVVQLVAQNGAKRDTVELPAGFAAFRYGWVTTSHKAQGRTAENVVVAAQSLDRQAFYVALSRGRQNMRLHCPEKDFLRGELIRRGRNRDSVHDLAAAGLIDKSSLLSLSEAARKVKTRTLPDTSFLSWKSRLAKTMEYVERMAARILASGRKVMARRARSAKYGYDGIVTEKTIFAVEREHAVALDMGKSFQEATRKMRERMEAREREAAAPISAPEFPAPPVDPPLPVGQPSAGTPDKAAPPPPQSQSKPPDRGMDL